MLVVLVVAAFMPTVIPALALGLFFVTLGVTAGGLIRPQWGERRFTRGRVVGFGVAVAVACLVVAAFFMPGPDAEQPGAIAGAWLTLALVAAIAFPIAAWIKAGRERRAQAQE